MQERYHRQVDRQVEPHLRIRIHNKWFTFLYCEIDKGALTHVAECRSYEGYRCIVEALHLAGHCIYD